MKKVAVIMSVYKNDRINFFILALNSLFSQTYNNYDIYIYRDGMINEDFEQCLINYEESNKNIFILRCDENHGLAHGLNRLIQLAMKTENYDFIARMDSDDICHSNRFEKQIDFFDKNNDIDVCGSFCKEFGANFSLSEKKLPLSHDELLKFSITRCPFIHPTVMFRSQVFNNNKILYPEDTKFTEDMALWFLLLSNNYKFSNVPNVLLDYRMNSDTVKRRSGINKAISEIKLRVLYMRKLKQTNLRNIILISSRLMFHFMPSFLMKFIYKYGR